MKERKPRLAVKAESAAPKPKAKAPQDAGSGWHSGLPPGIFLFLAFLGFYVWTATSSQYPFVWGTKKGDHYNLLAEGFLQGHLYLAQDPPKELLALPNPLDPVANEKYRLHDASLYNGHYYAYFGPVPVVVLYLPWRIITGWHIPNNLAAILFLLAGNILSCLLLFRLLQEAGIKPSWLQKRIVIIALCMCQTGPIILRRAYMYETAVAAGFCFAVGGLYFLARYAMDKRPRAAHAFWAGLCLGFTPGCRPNYVAFVAAVGVVYAVYLYRARRLRGIELRTHLVRVGCPVAACALLLLWYNYARFGNPLNIGQVYQLIGDVHDRGVTSKMSNLLPGLYKFLIQLPIWVRHFPFFELATDGYFGAEQWPKGFDHIEPVVGILPVSPLSVLGLVLPLFLWFWRATLSPTLRYILTAIFAAAAINIVGVVMSVNQVAQRYEMDFAPEFLVAALFVAIVLMARVQKQWQRVAGTAALLLVITGSALAQTSLSINGYENPLMDRNWPQFNQLAYFLGDQEGTLRRLVYGLGFKGTITFQNVPPGRLEALLTTGVPRRSNCVFVQYLNQHRVRFVVYTSGTGYNWGEPVAITPGQTYPIQLVYDSYPRTLKVALENNETLNVKAFFYPTSFADATVMRNEIGIPPNVQPFTGILNADLGLQFFAPATGPAPVK